MSIGIQPPPIRNLAVQPDGYFERPWLSWFNDLFEVSNISQPALNFDSPLVKTGTDVRIQQATESQNGYLSFTDWNIFNDKEPAISFGTTSQYLRGDKTWQVFGEATQILFADTNGGVAGSSTFIYDNDNIRVGLGTNSPYYALDIQKDVDNAGFIGLRIANINIPASSELNQSAGILFSLSRETGIMYDAGKVIVGKDSDFVDSADADSNMQFYVMQDQTSELRLKLLSTSSMVLYDSTAATGGRCTFTVEEDGDLTIYPEGSNGEGGLSEKKVGIGGSPTNKLSVNGDIGCNYLSVGAASLLSGIACISSAYNDTSPLILECTDTDANAGPVFELYRNISRTQVADGDAIGTIRFFGANDAAGTAEKIRYGEIYTEIGDVTDGTEDGRMIFRIIQNGAITSFLDLEAGTGATFYSDVLFSGAGTGLPYGCVYGNEIGWSQASAAQNTWYIVTGTAAGKLNLMTDNSGNELLFQKAGTYLVNYSITLEANAANKHIMAGISVGAVMQSEGQSHWESSLSQEVVLSGTAILEGAVSDGVHIRVRTTDTGTPTISVSHLHFTVIMVGG